MNLQRNRERDRNRPRECTEKKRWRGKKKVAVAGECGGVNCRGWGPLMESSSHKSRVMAQSLFSFHTRGSSSGLSLQQSQEQAIQTIWHAIYSSMRQYDYSAECRGFWKASAAWLPLCGEIERERVWPSKLAWGQQCTSAAAEEPGRGELEDSEVLFPSCL